MKLERGSAKRRIIIAVKQGEKFYLCAAWSEIESKRRAAVVLRGSPRNKSSVNQWATRSVRPYEAQGRALCFGSWNYSVTNSIIGDARQ